MARTLEQRIKELETDIHKMTEIAYRTLGSIQAAKPSSFDILSSEEMKSVSAKITEILKKGEYEVVELHKEKQVRDMAALREEMEERAKEERLRQERWERSKNFWGF